MRTLLARAALAAGCIVAASSIATAQSPPPPPFPVTPGDVAAWSQMPAVSAAIAACDGDHWRLCGGVFPGGGRIVRCLVANEDRLSPQCHSAMQRAWETIAVARGYAPERPYNERPYK